MALIACPECGSRISELAESCPVCGCPSRVWAESGTDADGIPRPLDMGQRFDLGTWGGEPLRWRVIDLTPEYAYVLCEKGIECQPYNDKQWSGNDWGTSHLKRWLGSTFRSGAFPAEAQGRIREVTCLDDEEATRLFATNEERACLPSKLAKRQGAYTSEAADTCCWWLRTPGDDDQDAVYVDMYGKINPYGCAMDDRGVTVRPALKLTL